MTKKRVIVVDSNKFRNSVQEDRSLRLDQIHVTQLFNQYNYHLDFRNGEDVSILIAPNGCGKTTVFNILYFMFNPTLEGLLQIKDIPFDDFACYLSNGKVIKIERKVIEETTHSDRLKRYSQVIDSFRFDDAPTTYRYKYSYSIDSKPAIVTEISDSILEDDIEKNKILKEMMNIVEQINYEECGIDITYIEANRLFNNNDKLESPIEYALGRIKKLLDSIRQNYSERQTKAQMNLPKQFVQESANVLDKEQFLKRWRLYINKIKKYQEIGLIDAAEELIEEDNIETAYEREAKFLSIYLQSFENTTLLIDKYYEKFALMVNILNERNSVTGKYYKYGREGIELYVHGQKLSLHQLSSGEKNDFIMFFKLIFDVSEDYVVLIDEPEISLHIEWQITFLDSITEICKMNNIQAVIATHSPSIINGHFELFAIRGFVENE